jgi:hypothetical protein
MVRGNLGQLLELLFVVLRLGRASSLRGGENWEAVGKAHRHCEWLLLG